MQREYHALFTERIQHWLDDGFGKCLLARAEVRQVVVDALIRFDGHRYRLREWVVMPNHVHVIVTPLGTCALSEILHTWKSYTSKAINKLTGCSGSFWQRESFDHIVRSAATLERIEAYIRDNPKGLQAGTFSQPKMLQVRQPAST